METNNKIAELEAKLKSLSDESIKEFDAESDSYRSRFREQTHPLVLLVIEAYNAGHREAMHFDYNRYLWEKYEEEREELTKQLEKKTKKERKVENSRK